MLTQIDKLCHEFSTNTRLRYKDNVLNACNIYYVKQIYSIQQEVKCDKPLHWTLINIIMKLNGGITAGSQDWDDLHCKDLQIYEIKREEANTSQYYMALNESIHLPHPLKTTKFYDFRTDDVYKMPIKNRMTSIQHKFNLNQDFPNGGKIFIKATRSHDIPHDKWDHFIKIGVICVWENTNDYTKHIYPDGGGMGIVTDCFQHGTTQFSGYTDYIGNKGKVQQVYDWFEWHGDIFGRQPTHYNLNEICDRWVSIELSKADSMSKKYMFESNLSGVVEDYVLARHSCHMVLCCPLNFGINFWVAVTKF